MRKEYSAIARDSQGNIISGCTVSVFLTGTSTPVSIYSTSTSITVVNSVQSSSTGYFQFFTDRIDYLYECWFDIVLSKTNYDNITYTKEVYWEPIDGVQPEWFGFSQTATATVNTAALRAAVASVGVTSYAFAGVMTGSWVIGNSGWVILPSGKYDINDNIPYFAYTKIKGSNTILYQTEVAKDVFYSESVYQNQFEGITFIGGRTHIYARNAVTPTVGIEGVMVKINNCEFQRSSSYAIKLMKSGAGGGEQGIIKNSRFAWCAQTLYDEFDSTTMDDTWNEPGKTYFADDIAQIVTHGNLKIRGLVGVPNSGTYVGTTNRWIDNYGYVSIDDSRFGGEGGGGIPIVYNFTDALVTGVYPYINGYSVIIRNSVTYCTGGVGGAIVLKTGLPNLILFENNTGLTSPAPVINTANMTGAVAFADYFVIADTAKQPLLSIKITNNTEWTVQMTSSLSDTDILRPWSVYNFMTYTDLATAYQWPAGNPNSFGNIITKNMMVSGTVGGIRRMAVEATADIEADTSTTITLNIPSGVRLLGVQLRVDTALTATELWDAVFSGGSTTAIVSGAAVAKQTKVNLMFVDQITNNTTNIAITKNGGGSFTAVGTIRAIVYYETFITMMDAP